MKFTFSIKQSLMQIARLLQMNLFVRRELLSMLKPPEPKAEINPQLSLAL
ncbi:MAG TPA: hypothetical protein VKA31_10030 [Mariprofundaceae bacterium]|nr:hypothetical protein [Mariprofundaceae bacterium]